MNAHSQIDIFGHPTIAEIAAIVGVDAAARLVNDFGGRALYVPRNPGPNHPLVVSIGHDLATSLAIRLSGGHLELPIASTKRRRILELDDKGWTRFAIAGAVGLTERRVYQVLAEVRGSDDQPSLFP